MSVSGVLLGFFGSVQLLGKSADFSAGGLSLVDAVVLRFVDQGDRFAQELFGVLEVFGFDCRLEFLYTGTDLAALGNVDLVLLCRNHDSLFLGLYIRHSFPPFSYC